MSDFVPNRVMSGKIGAGRYDFKHNTEASIELEEAESSEYHCESMHELVRDYMSDIEGNPTIDGIRAASKKYRSEAIRFEESLMTGAAGTDSYPDPDSWDLSDDLSDSREASSEGFCLSATVLELRGVARINEIRNLELAERYGNAEQSDIEISIRDSKMDYSGTIKSEQVDADLISQIDPEYRSSFAMFRAVERSVPAPDGRSTHWWNDVRKALRSSHENGNNTAYLLTRSGYDRVTMEGTFSEVAITPSIRGIERSKLESQSISEGWL